MKRFPFSTILGLSAVVFGTRQLGAGNNPNGAPPKPGEIIAKNYTLEFPGNTIEIHGVCKLDDADLVCWKPDGTKSKAVADEISEGMRKTKVDFLRTFQFELGKHNRILLVRKTIASGAVTSWQSPYHPSPYTGNSFDNWNDRGMTITNPDSSLSKFPRTELSVLTGSFGSGITSFPLRYQSLKLIQTSITIPVKAGPFKVEGNEYRVESVSDSPTIRNQFGFSGGRSSESTPTKKTYIKVRAIKIVDPDIVFSLHAASEKGVNFGGTDKNGEPISALEYMNQTLQQIKSDAEAQKTGKNPYSPDRWNSWEHSISPIHIDPRSEMRQGSFEESISLERGKIKTFAIYAQKRTIYIFDNIRLDPH